MEYDFDQMAHEFTAMRDAYLEYAKGASLEISERRLNRFIQISDRFFRTYPSPFQDKDLQFVSQSIVADSRSAHQLIKKKIAKLKGLKLSLEVKLSHLSASDPSLEKFQNYLIECEDQIKESKKRLSAIEESRLPG